MPSPDRSYGSSDWPRPELGRFSRGQSTWPVGCSAARRQGGVVRTLSCRGGSPVVGDGDVPVHRYRGFDAVAGRPTRTRCGSALAAHDEVLRSAVEAHGGWLFKHTGDGVCAAFGSARRGDRCRGRGAAAVGVAGADGDGDGRGRVSRRRLFRAGVEPHGAGDGRRSRRPDSGGGVDGGGWCRVSSWSIWASTDCGTCRAWSACSRCAPTGLRSTFPPLRTVDAVPGNLPVQTTSFVGRDVGVEGAVSSWCAPIGW